MGRHEFLWENPIPRDIESSLAQSCKIIKHNRVRYSVQPEPPKKSPSRNPESEGRVSVCLGDFFGGSGWTEYRTSVVFYFHPVISWIYIFMGIILAFILPSMYLIKGFHQSVIYVVLNCTFELFISRQSLNWYPSSHNGNIMIVCTSVYI